jgi:hypothetical protein
MATARSATNQTALACVVALLGVAGVSLSGSALAFGPLGHRIAGLLAERELCPAARSRLSATARRSRSSGSGPTRSATSPSGGARARGTT